jgi:hypothetical protein
MSRFALLVVAACAGSAPPPAAPPPSKRVPTCEQAVGTTVVEIMADQKRKGTEGDANADFIASMRGVMVASCRDDRWSETLRTCLATADLAESDKCQQYLTKEQYAAMSRRIDASSTASAWPPRGRERSWSRRRIWATAGSFAIGT